MNIILVDDEPMVLELLTDSVKEVLPKETLHSFTKATDALAYAKENRVDVAFLDINMRVMDGLTMAQKLQTLWKQVNIIFCTGYTEYSLKAHDLYCSGYLLKPVSAEKVRQTMAHLRYPIPNKKRAFAQTFGNFTLFIDGKPINFTREKSQMAVAYLVHRRGEMVSRKELSVVIFDDGTYDENRRSYLSKICSDIQKSFTDCGMPELLIRTPSALAINRKYLSCDLYDFWDGKPDAKAAYCGEYMRQYTFGEMLIPILDRM